ncbi:MAG: PAS domain-containing protein [Fimbriimonadaceae bacterium]
MAELHNSSDMASSASSLITTIGLSIPFWGRIGASRQTTPVINTELEALRNQLEETQSENAALREELHQTQSIQSATLERLRTTFYELPLPCFTVNDQANVIEWNRACEEFFFLKEHEAVDRPISDILGSGIFRNDAEGMIYMVFLGLSPIPIEIELGVKGELRKVKWFASPILDRSGQVVGALNTLAVVPRIEISNQN